MLGLVQIALILSLPAGAPYLVLCCFAICAWIYLAAGIVAWLRRPDNRLGAIMVAAGLSWLAAGFGNVATPALVAGGLILATLPLALVFHLLHAFPSGRLHGTASRLTVMAGYALCLAVQAPQYLFVGGPDAPWTVLRLAARPGIVDAAEWAQWAIGGLLVAVTVVILASRLRAAVPAQRRVLAPIFLYGIVAVLYVPFSSRTRGALPGRRDLRRRADGGPRRRPGRLRRSACCAAGSHAPASCRSWRRGCVPIARAPRSRARWPTRWAIRRSSSCSRRTRRSPRGRAARPWT